MEIIGLFLAVLGMFLTAFSAVLNLVAGNYVIGCLCVGACCFCVFAFSHYLEKFKSNTKIR